MPGRLIKIANNIISPKNNVKKNPRNPKLAPKTYFNTSIPFFLTKKIITKDQKAAIAVKIMPLIIPPAAPYSSSETYPPSGIAICAV